MQLFYTHYFVLVKADGFLKHVPILFLQEVGLK